MAIEFQDFGVDPDTATRMREKAYDKFINIAQPEAKEQRQIQRGQLVEDVSKAAAQNARMGTPEKTSAAMEEAQMKAAEMLPTQGKEQDTLNIQGSKMKEDMLAGRQTSALTRYLRKTADAKEEAATALAIKAFDLGIQGGELALHQNAYISDIGMQKLYQDLQAGRANKDDIQRLEGKLKLEAAGYKEKFDVEMAALKGQLEIDVANKNIEGAKSRMNRILNLAKKAAEAQAKAGNLASILSGAFGVIGAVVGGYYGGPAGAAAGGATGTKVGRTVNSASNT
jgi:hypothetical protein